jgi:hypothetical protein
MRRIDEVNARLNDRFKHDYDKEKEENTDDVCFFFFVFFAFLQFFLTINETTSDRQHRSCCIQFTLILNKILSAFVQFFVCWWWMFTVEMLVRLWWRARLRQHRLIFRHRHRHHQWIPCLLLMMMIVWLTSRRWPRMNINRLRNLNGCWC